MVEDDDNEAAVDRADPGNLIPPILGLVGIGLLAWGGWVLGLIDNPSGERFSQCAAITDDGARLACYDKLSIPPQPVKGGATPLRARSQGEPQ